jgi:soluble P-type ATPase
MPRQARLDVPGTLCDYKRHRKRRIAYDLKDRGNFVSRIGEIASDTRTVILPGHYEDERLSQFSQ